MSPKPLEPFGFSESTTRADGSPEPEITQPRLEVLEDFGQTANVPVGSPRIEGSIAPFWHTAGVISDPLEIYPGLAKTNSALLSAASLLDQAIALQSEAQLFLEEGNAIAGDDSVQKIRALLPELFCCRTIGDGFGSVVNAMHYSFLNANGVPLVLPQVKALGKALRLIRRKPFLSIEDAVDAVLGLEETGLLVEPEGVGSIADIEPDEGIS